MSRFATFISPHGFGHAARAAAVMSAVQTQRADAHFDIFTTVPSWFFADSLAGSYACHHVEADLGLVQITPMQEDLDATIDRLGRLLPFDAALVDDLADRIGALGCAAVICDIAPMGIAVARRAGLPSVLIENFTWDWIYEGYARLDDRFEPHLTYLREWFRSADVHIQTRPACAPNGRADLAVPPVSREPKGTPDSVRHRLGLGPGRSLVLITMGGTSAELPVPAGLDRADGAHFVVPAAIDRVERVGNVTRLPYRSAIYYPDLIQACDAVVAKVGYSTIAEAYRSGVPIGCIPRPRFRESDVLVRFVRDHMAGIEIPEPDVNSGAWLERLQDLLALPRRRPESGNGAAAVAHHLLSMVAT